MAIDYSTIRYLQVMGDSALIHYTDGTKVFAYPDGKGHFLPRKTGATSPDPGTLPPPVNPGDPQPGDAGTWVHPLAGAVMTSPYGPRGFDGVANFHYGADFSTTTAPVGGRIVAPTDLVVTIARANWGLGGSAGNCVKAHTTDNRWTMNFYHMSSISCAEGQTVKRGQPIGVEGQTGNATGTHLHFEMYQGVWRDPWPPPYNYGAQVLDPLPVLRSYKVNV